MMHSRINRICSLFLALCIMLTLLPRAEAIEPPEHIRCTDEEEQFIWDFLMDLTDNPVAAAGIMGNLFFESHLSSQNVETMGKVMPDLGPESYTSAVDGGLYTDFATDGFGYGLAQWTYCGRKQRLLELAKKYDTSIGDLSIQLELIADELKRFNMLYRISHADSLSFVSDYFLENFENPMDQGEAVRAKRHKRARHYYDKFYAGILDDDLTNGQREVINIAMHAEEYGISAQEDLCQAWVSDVYREAGFPVDDSASASQSAERFAVSEDLSSIPMGAAIYGHSSSRHGHVGIYVGDNQVYHNAGTVQVDTLSDWIANYRGFCWGWPAGTDLTTEDDPF